MSEQYISRKEAALRLVLTLVPIVTTIVTTGLAIHFARLNASIRADMHAARFERLSTASQMADDFYWAVAKCDERLADAGDAEIVALVQQSRAELIPSLIRSRELVTAVRFGCTFEHWRWEP